MKFIEKLRTFFRLMKEVRAARREGLSEEDAAERAVLALLDRELGDIRAPRQLKSRLPDIIAARWREPHADAARPPITVRHISLLRQMHFTWDPMGAGAPMLDPERPYGTAGLLDQLRGVYPDESDEAVARHHTEMMSVLTHALRQAYLDPGDYDVSNLNLPKQRAALSDANAISDADLGWVDRQRVRVTSEHIRLLRNIRVTWPSVSDCDARLARSTFPAATCDPERDPTAT